MALDVCEIDNRQQWDAFVSQAPTGHLMQSYQWGELMQRDGARIARLGVLAAGQLVAAVLAVRFTFPHTRTPWLYVPRGPVVADPTSPALPTLMRALHQIARRERAVVLTLEPNVEASTTAWSAALRGLGFQPTPIPTHVRHSWLLDLTPCEQHLLAGMKRSWRYNIKLAERSGVQTRLAQTPQDLQAFYRLYQQTSQRDDFIILPLRHYQDILDLFGDDACLYLAEHAGDLLAGHLLVRYGPCCWDMFGATAEAQKHLKPGYLLHWQTFLWAKVRGCTLYDFRGIPEILEPGEELWNVYEYKRGFGGFARLSLATHDYVYRPALYWPVSLASRARVAWRRSVRRRFELERTQHGQEGQKARPSAGEQEKEQETPEVQPTEAR